MSSSRVSATVSWKPGRPMSGATEIGPIQQRIEDDDVVARLEEVGREDDPM